MKYEKRTQVFRGANFLQFQSADGGVFLRCVGSACVTVESASRETFDKIDAAIGWGPAPIAGEQAAAKADVLEFASR